MTVIDTLEAWSGQLCLSFTHNQTITYEILKIKTVQARIKVSSD